MPDIPDVEVFILAAVCEETEEKRRQKQKRMWMNGVFVSGCTEGGFHTLF
jgi:hypothetical protein